MTAASASRVLEAVTSVTELRLDSNLVAAVSAQLLAGLRNLTLLSLANNSGLATIHPGALQHSPLLVSLDLASNPALTSLPPALLTSLHRLATLNLTSCSLSSLQLPASVLHWTSLGLQHNPWACDCGLASLARVQTPANLTHRWGECLYPGYGDTCD